MLPGDDYNERASWADVLVPFGWVAVYRRGDETWWRRPGKDTGWSATTGHCKGLKVFTTSTPFDPSRTYTKFGALAVLQYGGDHSACRKALAAEGYGTPSPQLASKEKTRTAVDSGTKPVDKPVATEGTPSTLDAANEPIVNGHREWKTCQHNSRIWLSRNGVSVRYNEFSGEVIVGGAALIDEMTTVFAGRIEADIRTPWRHKHIHDALVEMAQSNKFNPLTEWLNSCVWDGEQRLDGFFKKVWKCQENDKYLEVCARIFFGSAVARAFKPGCKADAIIVLQSIEQGTKKSSTVQALCPEDHLEWFAEDLGCDIGTEKIGNSLRGKWIIELGELNRVNRQTIESVKHFLSQTSDHFKMPYDRCFKDQKRTCTFVATTNNNEPLFDDENRRYFPIRCSGVGDIDWVRKNRDQLWAEAVDRHRLGITWWVDAKVSGNLDPAISDRQDEAVRGDDRDGILASALGNKADGGQHVEVGDVLSALGLTRERYCERPMQTQLGKCLERIHWIRDKSPGWRHREPKWTFQPPAKIREPGEDC